MKLAKSYKIILVITALALSLMLALCSLNAFTAKAEEGATTSVTCFSGGTLELTSSGAKLSVKNGESVKIKNELAIDDMAIELGEITNISKLNLVLTYDSYYVNGNKKVDGANVSFDKEIVNTFDVTSSANATVSIKVENGFVKVNGDDKSADVYYKIRKVDKAIASVKFEIAEATDGASFVIKSIDQKVGVEGYKQVFNDGEMVKATPVVSLSNEGLFVRNEDGTYSAKSYSKSGCSLGYTVCSVLGDVSASDLAPANGTNATISEKNDYVYFKSGATSASFDIKNGDTVCESYTVALFEKDGTNTAPEYIYDFEAVEAFKNELEKQYKENGKVVPLGTEIEIPSMEDFVCDDRTPYSKLTKTVYYASTQENTTSSMKFTLGVVGDYYFYVAFADAESEKMEQELFVETNDDGTVTYGEYGSSREDAETNQKYIFYFNIDEDTDIVITAPSKQGKGYKGTKYTASKFEILSGSSNQSVYKLEYTDKAEPTEDDWVEIKQYGDVEEDYSENGYTYEILKKINYNGEYTFTPDKVGKYRITVSVTSPLAVRSKTASTIIEVEEEAKIVTPATSNWFADNVWSVVFLSVGTLCLVGIIVLLFIKPKDKVIED